MNYNETATGEAKEFLERPTRIFNRIVVLTEQLTNLRLNMLPKAISYDKDRVQTSPQDPMPNFAARVDEINREILQQMKEFDKSLEEVTEAIMLIENDDAREVMAKKYVGKKDWRTIAEEVLMSEATMYRKHRIGLKAVAKILGERKIDSE